ncbi:YciI family protein [Pseudoxanthomonas sp. UTMC 1351]|uniref:YciI family protein n=1 Tax=Pseudoxanthomonas sp. UTMC 1351 TaxID=2695853 RepID=UPI0034CFA658
MRFMILLKSDVTAEAGAAPDKTLLAEMCHYHQALAKAGVLLAAEGLHPSVHGARVRFNGHQRTVTEGPFTDSQTLIAGFWLIQAKSREEAIEWVKRCPNTGDAEREIEIRQVFEAADFCDAFTSEPMEPELLRTRSGTSH